MRFELNVASHPAVIVAVLRPGDNMTAHIYVAIVTLLALLLYSWMGTRVSSARGKTGIRAPAMTGDPLLERTIRAHYNTLEWLPVFLTSLWLFAIYWNSTIAAIVGLVWIVGTDRLLSRLHGRRPQAQHGLSDPDAGRRGPAVRRAGAADLSGGDGVGLIDVVPAKAGTQ